VFVNSDGSIEHGAWHRTDGGGSGVYCVVREGEKEGGEKNPKVDAKK
jgi:hypothetical protein